MPEQPAVETPASQDVVATLSGHILSLSVDPIAEETYALTADESLSAVLQHLDAGDFTALRKKQILFSLALEHLCDRKERGYETLEKLLNDYSAPVSLHIVDGLAQMGTDAKDYLHRAGLIAIGDRTVFLVASELHKLGMVHESVDVVNAYLKRDLIESDAVDGMLRLLQTIPPFELQFSVDGLLATLKNTDCSAQTSDSARSLLKRISKYQQSIDSMSVEEEKNIRKRND